MAGAAVKSSHKRKKNIAAEGYEIRGECVWDVYGDIARYMNLHRKPTNA
jgi:hypothetical protein